MESNRQKFEELFSIELIDLFHEIKILIKDNAIDLLNNNNFNQHLEFIDLIYKNVQFNYNDFDDNISDNDEFTEVNY